MINEATVDGDFSADIAGLLGYVSFWGFLHITFAENDGNPAVFVMFKGDFIANPVLDHCRI